MSDILLEKIGVEKMKVNRVGGISKHYWHMVNVDGNWYHFDSSGWMQTGFHLINGNWFYLNEKRDGTRGAMVKDTTININSSGYIEI